MEGSQRVEYQLRRLGKQSSLIGVKDVMKLDSDVTRFGRHSGNNFYLDSSVLKHFISRWHAEIHCVQENNSVRYIIRDNSVNGTYVNNVRVKVNQVLAEGDEVIFGHVNGKNIQPGQVASQDDSEFYFKFEKIGSHLAPQTTDPLALPASPITSTSFDKRDETPPRYKLSSQGNRVVRKLITSPTSGRTLVLKDISNTGCQVNGLVSLDQIIAERHSTGSTGSSAQVAENPSPPILEDDDDVFRQAVKAVENFADSDDDIFNLDVDSPGPSKLQPTSSNSVISTLLSNPISAEPLVSMTTSFSPMSTRLNFTVSPAASPSTSKRKRAVRSPAGRKRARKSTQKSRYSKYHQESEPCSAIDCIRPSAEKVFWVQCDDCDMWYHTTCVGCSYDQVSQDDTEFKCGCL